MSQKRISNRELIAGIALRTGSTKKQTEEYLNVLQAVFQEAILKDKVLKINNLGSFKLNWNASRKSVNVQTGRPIELPGHYKLNFTPDSLLKELVNTPLAHLEAIELDDERENSFDDLKSDRVDPIKKLAEQASELQTIIADIQQLSAISLPSLSDNDQEDSLPLVATPPIESTGDDFEVAPSQPISENIQSAEIDKEEPIMPITQGEHLSNPQEIEQEQKTSELFNPFLQTSPTTSVDYVSNLPPVTRGWFRRWGWIAMIGMALLLSAGGYFYFSYFDSKNSADRQISSQVIMPVTLPADTLSDDVLNNSEEPFSSTEETSDIDSLSDLPIYEQSRVYTEFLGTETVHSGTSLAKLSRKYYESPLFWVYIYEANQSELTHPSALKVGQQLKIPKLDNRLTNMSDSSNMHYVKQLEVKYLKR